MNPGRRRELLTRRLVTPFRLEPTNLLGDARTVTLITFSPKSSTQSEIEGYVSDEVK